MFLFCNEKIEHACAYTELKNKGPDLLLNLNLQLRISGCAWSKVNSCVSLILYCHLWLGSPDIDGRRNSADQDSVRSCAYCCRPTSRVWDRPTSVQNLEKASRSHYAHMPITTSLVLNTEFNQRCPPEGASAMRKTPREVWRWLNILSQDFFFFFNCGSFTKAP